MDDDTYADVKLRLQKMAELKRGYGHELAIESNIHEEWEKDRISGIILIENVKHTARKLTILTMSLTTISDAMQ